MREKAGKLQPFNETSSSDQSSDRISTTPLSIAPPANGGFTKNVNVQEKAHYIEPIKRARDIKKAPKLKIADLPELEFSPDDLFDYEARLAKQAEHDERSRAVKQTQAELKQYFASRKTHTTQQLEADADVKNEKLGIKPYEKMTDDELIGAFARAHFNNDKTAEEDLREIISEKRVYERTVGKEYEKTSLTKLVKLYAEAEHANDIAKQNEVDYFIDAKIDAYMEEKGPKKSSKQTDEQYAQTVAQSRKNLENRLNKAYEIELKKLGGEPSVDAPEQPEPTVEVKEVPVAAETPEVELADDFSGEDTPDVRFPEVEDDPINDEIVWGDDASPAEFDIPVFPTAVSSIEESTVVEAERKKEELTFKVSKFSAISTDESKIRDGMIDQDRGRKVGDHVVVADGMGAPSAILAAETAVRTVLGSLDGKSDEGVVERIAGDILFQDKFIARTVDSGKIERGAGATLAGVVKYINDKGENKIAVYGVGDAAVFRLRGGVMKMLTTEESLPAAMHRNGEKYADHSDKASVITNVIGRGGVEISDYTVRVHDLLPGDRYIVSTDGLEELYTDVQNYPHIPAYFTELMSRPQEEIIAQLEQMQFTKEDDRLTYIVDVEGEVSEPVPQPVPQSPATTVAATAPTVGPRTTPRPRSSASVATATPITTTERAPEAVSLPTTSVAETLRAASEPFIDTPNRAVDSLIHTADALIAQGSDVNEVIEALREASKNPITAVAQQKFREHTGGTDDASEDAVKRYHADFIDKYREYVEGQLQSDTATSGDTTTTVIEPDNATDALNPAPAPSPSDTANLTSKQRVNARYLEDFANISPEDAAALAIAEDEVNSNNVPDIYTSARWPEKARILAKKDYETAIENAGKDLSKKDSKGIKAAGQQIRTAYEQQLADIEAQASVTDPELPWEGPNQSRANKNSDRIARIGRVARRTGGLGVRGARGITGIFGGIASKTKKRKGSTTPPTVIE